jgi:hypothetical protein
LHRRKRSLHCGGRFCADQKGSSTAEEGFAQWKKAPPLRRKVLRNRKNFLQVFIDLKILNSSGFLGLIPKIHFAGYLALMEAAFPLVFSTRGNIADSRNPSFLIKPVRSLLIF